MHIEQKNISDITNQIFNDDCFLGLKTLPDNSVDMVLTDPPYGVTDNEWDEAVLFGLLWASLKRVCKPNAVIVVHCQQPFTNELINSNSKAFKYCWYWNKGSKVGFLNAKKRPLKQIEELAVFWHGSQTGKVYNPQMTEGSLHTRGKGRVMSSNYSTINHKPKEESNLYYPTNLLSFSKAQLNFKLEEKHPTEKPLELEEYMIKTYSNPGNLILDPFCGRATTCVAALNTGRNFCAFEIDTHYYNLGLKRIQETIKSFENQPAENAKNSDDNIGDEINNKNNVTENNTTHAEVKANMKNKTHNIASLSTDDLLKDLDLKLPF